MSNDDFDVNDQEEIDAIQEFDFQRVGILLMIMEKCATVAPKATSLFGIAQAELEILNNEAKDIARSRAKKAADAKVKWEAAQQALRQQEAEAQAKRDDLALGNHRARAIPSQEAIPPGPKVDPNLGAPTLADRRV